MDAHSLKLEFVAESIILLPSILEEMNENEIDLQQNEAPPNYVAPIMQLIDDNFQRH